MHGFIHLLLEAFVTETLGPEYPHEIRRLAGIEGPALATEAYSDQLTLQFVQVIADYQGIHPDEVLYRFGTYFINAPLLERYYHSFLESHSSARSLLEHVTGFHTMLGANLKGVVFPKLEYIHHTTELLEVVYSSPRQLCRMLLGIIEGVGQRFNEPLEVREMECQRRGARACRVLIRFLQVSRADPLPVYPSQTGLPGDGPMYPPLAGLSGSGPMHPSQADIAGSGPMYPPRTGLPGSEPMYPSQAGIAGVGYQSRSEQPFRQPPAMPPEFARQGNGAAPDGKRQQEQAGDLLVLQALAADQAHMPGASGTHEPALGITLSLFEIAQRLTASGAPAEYARLSLLHRSITRLVLQGLIESKPDPHALRQSSSPDVMALGGQGILAAQRYRLTPTGQAWLRDMQRHGY